MTKQNINLSKGHRACDSKFVQLKYLPERIISVIETETEDLYVTKRC